MTCGGVWFSTGAEFFAVKGIFSTEMRQPFSSLKRLKIINKKPSCEAGFFGETKFFVYSEIELETFCFELSGLSMQPDKPTIINAIAKSAKIFFIIISSKGV
jgi:hypothetical protein